MKTVLVTGGSGFIGRATLLELSKLYKVRAPVRQVPNETLANVEYCLVEDLRDVLTLPGVFDDVDVLIHLAAKAHTTELSAKEFCEFNCDLTIEIAKSFALNGGKRFIFLSSIGVNGNQTHKPFTVDDEPRPQEPYALSKFKAEIGLKRLSELTGLEYVILRPPLVYGAGAPGNFGRLLKLVQKNYPLPLGSVNNLRSLVHVDNLVNLIKCCIESVDAANETFLVSDGHDISTSELFRQLIEHSNSRAWLVPIPSFVLRASATLLGKKVIFDKICGNLQIDSRRTCQILQWQPPVSLDDGFKKCFQN